MIHYITAQGLGQPWIGNELGVLKQDGIPFCLHAMRQPERVHFDSEWALRIHKETRTLYPLPPVQVLCDLISAPFRFRGAFLASLVNALFGKRENLRARVASLAHLVVACWWARRLVQSKNVVSHIHSQWAFSSATIGYYASRLLGVPFSFTGHASDLFRDRVALEDKIRHADFIICISKFHRKFYQGLGARDHQLYIAYCGIDVNRFAPAASQPREEGPFRILSSGRLVEKKGFGDLVLACKVLAERHVDFQCMIAGDGPLEKDLRRQISTLGLSERVHLTGKPLKQEDIPAFMHQGDVYCLPCVWSRDNDVDGLPQMLMEAMACGLPAISTRIVGIPDLVIDGCTGLLVEPGRPGELAEAILRLHASPADRARFAEAGRRWVLEQFNLETSLEPLVKLFRKKVFGSTHLKNNIAPLVAEMAKETP